MSKEYKVKFTEIFPVPQNKTEIDDVLDDNDDANTPQSDDEDLIDEIKIEDNSEKLNKENEKVSDDDQKTTSTGRPKRLAAQKQRDKMKEILPCLNIKKKIIPENEQRPYRHGWNYEDWLKEINDYPYYEPVDPVLLVRSLYVTPQSISLQSG